MKKKILVNVFHPSMDKSRYNKAMVQAVTYLPGVTVRNLYDLYPNHKIDVGAEQALTIQYDLIVFQHPFYWYSAPALMKEWEDQVLSYGFAFGSQGSKLKDKVWAQAVTVGSSFESYGAGKANPYSVEDLLRPFELTSRFCGMSYAKPFVFHAFKSEDPAQPKGAPTDTEIMAKATAYADYLKKLSNGSSE